jgi:hypothetical protein
MGIVPFTCRPPQANRRLCGLDRVAVAAQGPVPDADVHFVVCRILHAQLFPRQN